MSLQKQRRRSAQTHPTPRGQQDSCLRGCKVNLTKISEEDDRSHGYSHITNAEKLAEQTVVGRSAPCRKMAGMGQVVDALVAGIYGQICLRMDMSHREKQH